MPDVRVRRPVAVLLSRFPLITETFILREITELERQGQPVLLVPMIREHPKVVHPEAIPWVERALFTPWFSPAIALAVLRALLQKPDVTLHILAWMLVGSLFHPATLFKSLLLLPKSIYLAEQLAANGVRHVHAHFATHPTTIARIISMLSGITFSFTTHAHDIYVERTLLRKKLRDARFVRAISQFNRHFLETLYPREAAGKVEVVHVGIEPERYTPGASQEPNEVPRLICVAALKPYKGVPFLVEACRLLAEAGVAFRCDIIGTGPMRSAVRRAVVAAGLHDRIRLRGALPQHEVAEEIRNSDIFVLPSIIAADGQMEGIPVALMEAMAARKPVVTTAISGIPELVRDGVSGLLVDPGNPRSLADAIRKLIDDPALRRRLAHEGCETVREHFDLRACTAALLQLLDRENAPPEQDAVAAVELIAHGAANYGLRGAYRSADAAVFELVGRNGADGRGDLIVKRHLQRDGQSRAPQARAHDEFVLLQRLDRHFAGQSELGVPTPVRLDRETATVVMMRANGVPLTKLVRDARDGRDADGDALRVAAQGTGRWLHHFQAMERADGGEPLRRVVARSLQYAGSIRAPRHVAARLLALQEKLRGRQCPAVSHHGDFWPGNIFAHARRVEVVDFEGYGLSLAAHDIAYFFLHLSLYFRWRGDQWINAVRECFFDGYGGALDPAELELCRLATALQMAAKAPPASFAQRMIRRTVLWKELSR